MTLNDNIHKHSFMFMTGVMSCLWHCHVSLMHTPSNKVLPYFLIIGVLIKTLKKKKIVFFSK